VTEKDNRCNYGLDEFHRYFLFSERYAKCNARPF
jgi:hypothetical protein